MSNRGFRRVLALCPVAVLVLWIAGVAHFHDMPLSTSEWLVTTAAAFALHALWRRMARPRPLPKPPPNTSPTTLAAMAAAVVAVPVALLSGLLEGMVETQLPSRTHWGLRTLWHGACAYAICYCNCLLQLTAPQRPDASA